MTRRLITAVAVVTVLGAPMTPAWAGHHGVTLLLDPADGGPDAASCDILRATSQPIAHSKIRHTVTTRGEVGYDAGLTEPTVVLIGNGKHPKAPKWHIKTLSAAAAALRPG